MHGGYRVSVATIPVAESRDGTRHGGKAGCLLGAGFDDPGYRRSAISSERSRSIPLAALTGTAGPSRRPARNNTYRRSRGTSSGRSMAGRVQLLRLMTEHYGTIQPPPGAVFRAALRRLKRRAARNTGKQKGADLPRVAGAAAGRRGGRGGNSVARRLDPESADRSRLAAGWRASRRRAAPGAWRAERWGRAPTIQASCQGITFRAGRSSGECRRRCGWRVTPPVQPGARGPASEVMGRSPASRTVTVLRPPAWPRHASPLVAQHPPRR